ncbi:hypothetical protein DV736_g1682, partial [Chaetothyriales sp. CBS 134916]
MFLESISLVDYAVFGLFLIPQLFYNAGVLSTIGIFVKALPFLLLQLPLHLYREWYLLKPEQRSPFSRKATIYQDIVVRCIGYVFATFPPRIMAVFLSKWVALPFLRYRLLRHGYLRSPIFYKEVVRQGFRGLWIIYDENSDPDLIIYYCHGGGFLVGSTYFYLEFLMTWLTRLREQGYRNPACFALEYTLVPHARAPIQLNEARAGYQFLLDTFGGESAKKTCLSGDSAGGTLVLSMLLYNLTADHDSQLANRLERPGLVLLLSPWTHLVSELNRNTPSDYLDQLTLHLFAQQYAGRAAMTDEVLSPGLCVDKWKNVEPEDGIRIVYGAEEVFAPPIEEIATRMKRSGVLIKAYRREGSIHVWPIVDMFLGSYFTTPSQAPTFTSPTTTRNPSLPLVWQYSSSLSRTSPSEDALLPRHLGHTFSSPATHQHSDTFAPPQHQFSSPNDPAAAMPTTRGKRTYYYESHDSDQDYGDHVQTLAPAPPPTRRAQTISPQAQAQLQPTAPLVVPPGPLELALDVKTKFAVARIKRIMQADEDIGKVAQATPTAMAKALELFMVALITKGAAEARRPTNASGAGGGGKRITAQHLKSALMADPQFDFLSEQCASVPDESAGGGGSGGMKGMAKSEAKSDDSIEEDGAPTKKRSRGVGKREQDD